MLKKSRDRRYCKPSMKMKFGFVNVLIINISKVSHDEFVQGNFFFVILILAPISIHKNIQIYGTIFRMCAD